MNVGFEDWYKTPGPAFFDANPEIFVVGASHDPIVRPRDILRYWRSAINSAVLSFVQWPRGQRTTPEVDNRELQVLAIQLNTLVWDADSVFDELIEAHHGYSPVAMLGKVFESASDYRPCPEEVFVLIDEIEMELFETTGSDAFNFVETSQFNASVPYLSLPIEIDGVITDVGPSFRVEDLSPRHFRTEGPIRSSLPMDSDKGLAGEIRRYSAESGISVMDLVIGGEYEDEFNSKLDASFLTSAVAARLAVAWEDSKSISAYRWGINWFDEINYLRETFLAGLRVWIESTLQSDTTCKTGEDLRALLALANELLDAAEAAFTREAPSSLLGEDDFDILRAAFPLMFLKPAIELRGDTEIRTSWRESMRRKWKDCGSKSPFEDWLAENGCAFEDLDVAYEMQHPSWNETIDGFRKRPMCDRSTKTEQGRVAKATFRKIAAEVSRLGVNPGSPPSSLDEARRLVNDLVEEALCMLSFGQVVPTPAQRSDTVEGATTTRVSGVAPDGPVRPDGFRYEGHLYDGVREMSWRLIIHLWNAANHSASFDDLAEFVWGDRELRHLDESQFGTARRDANRFFNEHSLPFRVRSKREHQGRIAWLEHG